RIRAIHSGGVGSEVWGIGHKGPGRPHGGCRGWPAGTNRSRWTNSHVWAALMVAARTYGGVLRRSAQLGWPWPPNAPSHGACRAWMQASERPLAIDLFSRAGGLSYGLEAAG